MRAELRGEHAEPAGGAPDQHAVAGLDVALRDQHPVGGEVDEPVGGGLVPGERLRLRQQLLRLHLRELRERAPGGLVAPDHLAGRGERVEAVHLGVLVGGDVAVDHDLVAGLPARDALADLPDDAGGVGAADVVPVLGVVAVAPDRDRLARAPPRRCCSSPRRPSRARSPRTRPAPAPRSPRAGRRPSARPRAPRGSPRRPSSPGARPARRRAPRPCSRPRPCGPGDYRAAGMPGVRPEHDRVGDHRRLARPPRPEGVWAASAGGRPASTRAEPLDEGSCCAVITPSRLAASRLDRARVYASAGPALTLPGRVAPRQRRRSPRRRAARAHEGRPRQRSAVPARTRRRSSRSAARSARSAAAPT